MMRATGRIVGLGLVLFCMKTSAQGIVTQTISVDTGSCAVASGTAAPVRSVKASTLSNIPPEINSSFGTYTFTGFYALPVSGNILDEATSTSPKTTLDTCLSFCRGSPYVALDKGDECLCGTSAPTSRATSSLEFLIPCAGDSKAACGSPGLAIVYQRSQQMSQFSPSGNANASSPPSYVYTSASTIKPIIVGTASSQVSTGGAGSYVDIVSSSIANTFTASPSLGLSGDIASTSANSASNAPALTLGSSTFSSASSPATTGDPCSDTNKPVGVDVNTENSQSYNVSCEVLFDSDIISTLDAGTFQLCLSLCDNQPGCIAVSFKNTFTTSNCQLLSAISEVIYGEKDFDSGHATNYTLPSNVVYSTLSSNTISSSTSSQVVLVIFPPTIVGASVSAASTSSLLTVPLSSLGEPASSTVAAFQTSLTVPISPSLTTASSSIIIPGTYSPTAIASSDTMSSATALLATTSLSSTVIESSISSPAAASPLSTAVGSSILSAAASTSSSASQSTPSTVASTEPLSYVEPDCNADPPVGNYTQYTDRFAVTYDSRCGLAIQGQTGDVNAHADTFTKCLEYCSLLEGCIAVTYLNGSNAANNNENCYPYYTFTGYTSVNATSNLFSGVDVDGASQGAIGPEDLCGSAYSTLVQNTFGPDTFGTCYHIGCGQYISPGTLLIETDMTTLEGCLTYCSDYDTCTAINWLGPHTQGVRDNSNCMLMASINYVSPEAPSKNAYAISTPCAADNRIAAPTVR